MEKVQNGGRLGPLGQNLPPPPQKKNPLDPPLYVPTYTIFIAFFDCIGTYMCLKQVSIFRCVILIIGTYGTANNVKI